jgi:hypothetical protein
MTTNEKSVEEENLTKTLFFANQRLVKGRESDEALMREALEEIEAVQAECTDHGRRYLNEIIDKLTARLAWTQKAEEKKP